MTHVIVHNLQNLSPNDGVKLLRSLGVVGNVKELEQAVREYGHHALALSLLGNVLRLRHKGDVLKRDTLKGLVKTDGSHEISHAFKVMQAYEGWFAGEPELALLHLLGLFDHPIGQDVLQVLWDEQISNLTAGISEDDWLEAITTLREEHHLLSQHEKTDGMLNGQLDCHPLIREYFGKQLRDKQPDTWKQAHVRLYEYYKALPQKLYSKEFPDTLEEMQPLFSAVAHGCAAGLHQQTLNEIYLPRIRRKIEDSSYITQKLGAFNDDLAVLAHFFIVPWHSLVTDLEEVWQAHIVSWTGFALLALGRLREAVKPMQIAVDIFVGQENWRGGIDSNNILIELQLSLGDVREAVVSSQHGIGYADQSLDLSLQAGTRAARADALHQVGEVILAFKLFDEAEKFHQKHQPRYPRMYGISGFYYCDLLLAQVRMGEALNRAEYDLACWNCHFTNGNLIDFSLPILTLGCAYWKQGNFPKAIQKLDQAIAGLRKAGQQNYLFRGLLARAGLHRDIRNPDHNFTRACQDLQEVFDIAEPSGMRLHLTDYHLEMARLLIAEWESSTQFSFEDSPRFPLEKGEPEGISVQQHVAKAAKLIEETGYKRRLSELEELKKRISRKPTC